MTLKSAQQILSGFSGSFVVDRLVLAVRNSYLKDDRSPISTRTRINRDTIIDDFFAADAYRSSDHDPLHVDLNLTADDGEAAPPADDDSGGGGGLGWLWLALVLAAGRRRRA